MVGRTILVVDDDASIQSLLQDLLGGEYEVEVASDGIQALESLERNNLDLMLLDLGLPRLDGLAVIERLRADPRFASLPIIVFSAFPELRARLTPHQVQGIIPKPFQLWELLDQVNRVLQPVA